MIPVRDANPSATHPIVNNVLIGLCVVVYLLEVTYRGGMTGFVSRYGLVPAEPRLFAFFSSMFMHGGFWHLLLNMWFLYIFGDNIEERLGSARYAVFYLLCGLFSALAHFMLTSHPGVPVVGASGAIAGVMGAYLVLFPTARILTLVPLLFIPFFFEIPAFIFLGFWFVMQLLSAVGTSGSGFSGVAWWAHVGGFVAGIVLLKAMGGFPRQGLSEHIRMAAVKKKTPRLQVIRPGGGGQDPNLYGTINITGREGETGTVKTVNIPWGFQSRFYRVTVPPGTRPGSTLRLAGLGKKMPDGNRGDVLLKVTTK
ncbi:MAG: rhomboid family intramembrane serine protease [Desulfosudaceae bacterium]